MDNMNEKPLVNLLTSPAWEDYQLLDSGNGRKLEQFGPYRLIRPEAEAVWSPMMPETEWQKASGEFIPAAEENGGHWKLYQKIPLHHRDIGAEIEVCHGIPVGKKAGIGKAEKPGEAGRKVGNDLIRQDLLQKIPPRNFQLRLHDPGQIAMQIGPRI